MVGHKVCLSIKRQIIDIQTESAYDKYMYKPIYDRASGSKRIAEIFTWVLLCILIPSTALGYFAEGSIPGQPLYPIKLGIEKTALSLQFLSPQAQASYQVGLVNKRF